MAVNATTLSVQHILGLPRLLSFDITLRYSFQGDLSDELLWPPWHNEVRRDTNNISSKTAARPVDTLPSTVVCGSFITWHEISQLSGFNVTRQLAFCPSHHQNLFGGHQLFQRTAAAAEVVCGCA